VGSVATLLPPQQLGRDDKLLRIHVYVRGLQPGQALTSPSLTPEQAETQLNLLSEKRGADTINLPWGVFAGAEVIAAILIEE
jgi:hypothetical protein